MQSETQKNVVLLGAGHAHLYVARHARDFYRESVKLTLVDPGHFWYSGMGTGMLGGAGTVSMKTESIPSDL